MKKNKLLRYLIIATVALLILAVVGKKAGWFGNDVTIKVAVEQPEKRTITEIVTANGKVQPEIEVMLSPDVSGEIVELNVKEGEDVEKGDLLLKIKPDTYISMVDRAQASLNGSKANYANSKAVLEQVDARFKQAERSYNRNKMLWEKKAISEAEYENALSSYEVAKAELNAAKRNVESAKFSVESAEAALSEAEENLQKTIIYAPMTGTVSRLNVEEGERVVGTMQMAGTELLRIANLDRMEVRVEVNENDIVRVAKGDTALVEIDAYLGETFKAVVTEIANSATTQGAATDQVTNFDVKVFLLQASYQHLIDESNPNPFRPGMSASVDIQTNTRYDVISVPIQAVTTRAEEEQKDKTKDADSEEMEVEEVVFVVASDTVEQRVVETGIMDRKYIEIKKGLVLEEKVVIAPFSAISRRLKPGMNVEVKKKEDLFKED